MLLAAVVVCAPSLPGFVAETETLCAPRTDRQTLCVYWFVDAHGLCCLVLLSQVGYPVVVAGGTSARRRPPPPVPLVDSCTVCCVVWTGRGPSCSVGKFMCPLFALWLLRAQRGILTSGVDHTVLGFSGNTCLRRLLSKMVTGQLGGFLADSSCNPACMLAICCCLTLIRAH